VIILLFIEIFVIEIASWAFCPFVEERGFSLVAIVWVDFVEVLIKKVKNVIKVIVFEDIFGSGGHSRGPVI